MILDDHGNNLDSFITSLESFRSFRGPLLHKPVTGQELFFALSNSKPALDLLKGGKRSEVIFTLVPYSSEMLIKIIITNIPVDLYSFYLFQKKNNKN